MSGHAEFIPLDGLDALNARNSAAASPEEDQGSKQVAIVKNLMQPLYKWLLHAHVEEIAINRPGEVWQRLRQPPRPGEFWIRHEDPGLTYSYLRRVCYYLANVQNIKDFGPEQTPLVYGDAPGGHRFGAGIGPNIQYGAPNDRNPMGSVCMCIRQYVPDLGIELGHYKIERGKEISKSVLSVFSRDNDPNDPYARIFNSLTRGDHLLLSGATGTGKTSLLNYLISKISPFKRVITLEDTREITVNAPNRVHVVLSRTNQANGLTYSGVRDLIVRMTPDIVLAGELSTKNAATVWDLMTSGHGHFMTTIHAESPDEAVSTFIKLVGSALAQAGQSSTVEAAALREEMFSKLRIIQLQRDEVRGRYISDIK